MDLHESPGQQAANRRVRKGTKRPEHGPWPQGKMTAHEKALGNVLKGKNIEGKKGFDGKKRWGNSALKGHGVNSPAMMEARSKLKKAN